MRILENTTEFNAYYAAKNGLLDSCDMDTLSHYIQPGDNSIDFALAGASSTGKQTLADFLIEHGADKKYLSLGKIYPLYQQAIQTVDDDTLIEFARYFFHFPYRNNRFFDQGKVEDLLYHCGFSKFKSRHYNPSFPLPPLDSTDSEVNTYLTSFENCAEITAFLAGTKNDIDLLDKLQRITHYTHLYTGITQSAIWGAIKENHQELSVRILSEKECFRIANATGYAAVVFNQVDLFFYLISHKETRITLPEMNWRLLSHRIAASNCFGLLKCTIRRRSCYDHYYYSNDPRSYEMVGYAASHNHRELVDHLISTDENPELLEKVAMRMAIDYKQDDLVTHLNARHANNTLFARFFGGSEENVTKKAEAPLFKL